MTDINVDALDGVEYLDLALKVEESCALASAMHLDKLGGRAPVCLDRLGRALNALSGAAACRWGCSKDDHVAESLLGRAASGGHAAYRMMMHGFYDESLAQTRSLCELANLFALFASDTYAFAKWKATTQRERVTAFSPVKVRIRLEELGASAPIDKERYSRLCEAGVHVTPATRPNAHSPDGIARLGGEFQPVGFLVALNELSWALCCAIVTGSHVASVKGVAERLACAGLSLNESIGGVTLLTETDAHDHIRRTVKVADSPWAVIKRY